MHTYHRSPMCTIHLTSAHSLGHLPAIQPRTTFVGPPTQDLDLWHLIPPRPRNPYLATHCGMSRVRSSLRAAPEHGSFPETSLSVGLKALIIQRSAQAEEQHESSIPHFRTRRKAGLELGRKLMVMVCWKLETPQVRDRAPRMTSWIIL